MSDEKYYEMLWNCDSCGAKGLFAKSQKHCPLCGAAQNPEKRYFPEEGQEVEVQGHQYVGADWHCPYCQSPNGAAAAFCGSCGGPRDGSKEVRSVTDPAAKTPEQPEPLVSPAASGGFPWFKIVLVLLVLVAGFFIVRFLWKSDETLKVVALDWNREVDIERFAAVEESRWCNELPAGAIVVRRTMEEKGRKQVPNGETCREVRIDQRDGTFTKKRECTPKFKEVPEMAYKCRYRANRWTVVRTEKARGGNGIAPQWPASNLRIISSAGAEALGNERPGSKRERYSVQLQPAEGEALWCTLKPEVWAGLKPGDNVMVKMRASGDVDCDDFRRL